MLTTACCLVVWLGLELDCARLVSGYAHVFVLLSVVIVPYPVVSWPNVVRGDRPRVASSV